jgi:hypothetical protein
MQFRALLHELWTKRVFRAGDNFFMSNVLLQMQTIYIRIDITYPYTHDTSYVIIKTILKLDQTQKKIYI